MAKEHNQFTPFIHLSTDIIQAGTEMIERIGSLTACRRYEERFELRSNPQSSDWVDLRKAVQRAADALRNYDACMLDGLEKVTREQFCDAAEVL
jgi:hypothetical protein